MPVPPFVNDIPPQEQPERQCQPQNQQHVPSAVVNVLAFFRRKPPVPLDRRDCNFPEKHRCVADGRKKVVRRNQDILLRHQIADDNPAPRLGNNRIQPRHFGFEQIRLNQTVFIVVHHRRILAAHFRNRRVFIFPFRRLRPQCVQCVLHIFGVLFNPFGRKLNYDFLLGQKCRGIVQALTRKLLFPDGFFNFLQLPRNGLVVKRRLVLGTGNLALVNAESLRFRTAGLAARFSAAGLAARFRRRYIGTVRPDGMRRFFPRRRNIA